MPRARIYDLNSHLCQVGRWSCGLPYCHAPSRGAGVRLALTAMTAPLTVLARGHPCGLVCYSILSGPTDGALASYPRSHCHS